MTKGEKRVRTDFNVSNDTIIDNIKQKSAELIDICDVIKESATPIDSEQIRLVSLAQTAYEEAAMWAVKAATYKS